MVEVAEINVGRIPRGARTLDAHLAQEEARLVGRALEGDTEPRADRARGAVGGHHEIVRPPHPRPVGRLERGDHGGERATLFEIDASRVPQHHAPRLREVIDEDAFSARLRNDEIVGIRRLAGDHLEIELEQELVAPVERHPPAGVAVLDEAAVEPQHRHVFQRTGMDADGAGFRHRARAALDDVEGYAGAGEEGGGGEADGAGTDDENRRTGGARARRSGGHFVLGRVRHGHGHDEPPGEAPADTGRGARDEGASRSTTRPAIVSSAVRSASGS